MHNFFFGIYPYIALSVLLIGSIARYERDPFTWKSSSSQLLRRKQLILGSVLFHVGVLVIFFGHLVGLLTPIWIFDATGQSATGPSRSSRSWPVALPGSWHWLAALCCCIAG